MVASAKRSNRDRKSTPNLQSEAIRQPANSHFQGTPLYGSPSNLKKLEKQATSRMPTGNLFFVDYSNATAQRRKAFSGIQKELYNLGLPSFLIYPATLRVTSRGKQQSFGTVEQAEDFLQKNSNPKTQPRRQLFPDAPKAADFEVSPIDVDDPILHFSWRWPCNLETDKLTSLANLETN